MLRHLVLLAALLTTTPANAYPCWMIKAAYAPFKKHGVAAAEKWARANGYSEDDIRDARKCLRQ